MTLEEKIKFQLGDLLFMINAQAIEIEQLKTALSLKEKHESSSKE